jgi:hypothetical protein
MAFSKHNTIIALGLIGALAIQVGCGNGDKKRPVGVNKALSATEAEKAKAAKAKQDEADRKAGRTPAPAVPGKGDPTKTPANLSADLERVKKEEAEFQAGQPVQKDDLIEGAYNLDSISTSVYYLKKNEELRAVHSSPVKGDAKTGYELTEAKNGDSAGAMVTEVDEAREIDLPVLFTVDKTGGTWNPARREATNIKLNSIVKSGRIEDRFFPAAEIKPSVLNMLATGALTKDRALSIKDDKGVLVTMRLFKDDETHVRIWLTFDEVLASGAKGADASLTRNVYLNYTVTAKAAKPATTTTAPPKDDEAPKDPKDLPVKVE